MKLTISAISDIGNVRENNEDMLLIGNEFLRDDSLEREFNFDSAEHPLMIAVADGMGGHQGGEYASEIAITEMNAAVCDLKNGAADTDLQKYFSDRVQKIHQKLLEEGTMDETKTDMGSTFVGILFFQNSIYLINIGDSRSYRLRNGLLVQLSRDHSLREMTGNPDAPSNIIVNSLGAGEKIFCDFEDISQRVLSGDSLLLCSDGLSDELDDEEIETILSNSSNALDIVNAVKSKEAKDNISVILAYFDK